MEAFTIPIMNLNIATSGFSTKGNIGGSNMKMVRLIIGLFDGWHMQVRMLNYRSGIMESFMKRQTWSFFVSAQKL